ncbi:MAG: hypothetical protein IPK00_25475 [Deltaproteobacteria bacterium]|nr:hypothetical protein [Deltaproteobacteria bacterium]
MAGEPSRASDTANTTGFAEIRRAVGWVAALNLGYFFVEIVVARRIDSVSLLADSIDFLEDATINSARNDAAANVGIIAAGVVTAGTGSIWPDLAVGLAIFVMNLDAAVEVHRAARRELRLAGFPAERQHRV